MGSQMTSKYSGNCKVCGSTWKEGEQMFYQKDPKCMCNKKECFEKQGGKISEYKPFARSGQGMAKDELSLDKIKGIGEPARLTVYYTQKAHQEAFRHQVFMKALEDLGYKNPAVMGMLYNNAFADDRE